MVFIHDKAHSHNLVVVVVSTNTLNVSMYCIRMYKSKI